jgi:tetratricopeptide (TPR) repeat protein
MMNGPPLKTRFGPRLAARTAIILALVGACSAQGHDPSLEVAGPSSFGGLGDEGERANGSFLGDYLAGSYALNVGQLDQATMFLERAHAAAPDDPELSRQVYLLALADGRYDRAIELAEQLVAIDPSDEEAKLLLALNDARAGRFDAAREGLARLDQGGIAGLAVPFLDAWAMFGEDGADVVDQSLARLERGESLGPLNVYHGAMLLYLAGRLDKAEAMLRDGMPDDRPAPVRLVQAQASLLAHQGDGDAALRLVREQAAERPDQPVLESALAELEAGRMLPPPFDDATGGMADALWGIAQALHQEQGGARAVLYARLALFLKPDLAEATLLIGDVFVDQQNFDAAINTYEGIDNASPISFAGKLRIASALHELDRKEQAFALLEDLVAAEPERVQALVELGNLLRRDEQYERAESAYSRAIERLGPPEREDWTLFYARGIAYERTKRWPQAEADFLQALELEPEQPFVLNYLGYSWVDMGVHLDEARDMLNRAVALRPDDGFIVDSMGWVHYRLGEFPQAVESLERAVELEPGDPVINDHLGDAYWRVGRHREARYQWQRALTLEPDEELIETIEQKLKSGLPAPDRA